MVRHDNRRGSRETNSNLPGTVKDGSTQNNLIISDFNKCVYCVMDPVTEHEQTG